ncbi:hypothetical protein OG252_27490 [Streptomyces sp. NBC_01352]|uniref:Uncharacterized protein n=1 Tax=Streptomyces plumbiresistens TaxID=511811 RepID=A0ABP7QGE3_9ACTN|nr:MULTISPECIES: hypothetical protein [unclassified Streptomyces]MCX4699734.1 hypothetical protein [Streptomyces sp. NBC_01373]
MSFHKVTPVKKATRKPTPAHKKAAPKKVAAPKRRPVARKG